MSGLWKWLPGWPRHGDEHLTDRIQRIMFALWLAVLVAGLVFGNYMLTIFAFFVLIIVPLWQFISGRLAGKIYDPSGSTIASRPAYSAPESLAVRGRFEEAINAYEIAAADEPDDPEPWLRIARIERMDLRRPQRALEALRAARTRAAPGSSTALLIAREIAELWLRDLKQPPRAMPELARLAADHPGTPTGKWAATELAELKQKLAAGEFDVWVKGPDPGPDSTPPPQ